MGGVVPEAHQERAGLEAQGVGRQAAGFQGVQKFNGEVRRRYWVARDGVLAVELHRRAGRVVQHDIIERPRRLVGRGDDGAPRVEIQAIPAFAR